LLRSELGPCLRVTIIIFFVVSALWLLLNMAVKIEDYATGEWTKYPEQFPLYFVSLIFVCYEYNWWLKQKAGPDKNLDGSISSEFDEEGLESPPDEPTFQQANPFWWMIGYLILTLAHIASAVYYMTMWIHNEGKFGVNDWGFPETVSITMGHALTLPICYLPIEVRRDTYRKGSG